MVMATNRFRRPVLFFYIGLVVAWLSLGLLVRQLPAVATRPSASGYLLALVELVALAVSMTVLARIVRTLRRKR